MRIACPFCGLRSNDEFVYLGDARLKERPPGDAGESAFHDYVYLRDNPRGQHRELWQHEAGCRRWLIVTRNTATHEIASVDFASGAEKPR